MDHSRLLPPSGKHEGKKGSQVGKAKLARDSDERAAGHWAAGTGGWTSFGFNSRQSDAKFKRFCSLAHRFVAGKICEFTCYFVRTERPSRLFNSLEPLLVAGF